MEARRECFPPRFFDHTKMRILLMRHVTRPIWSVVLATLVLVSGVYFLSENDRAWGAPPLSLEGFLDEKLPEASDDEPKLKVDNSACYVCHGNYDGESLVTKHGMEEIGCIKCHGESLEHRDDEDHVTPPDVMYPLEEIDKACRKCHEEHDAPAVKVVKRWRERCPKKTNPKELVCTDCHFQHRMKFRTVWWNKKTREFIIRKEGERIKRAVDNTSEAGTGDKAG